MGGAFSGGPLTFTPATGTVNYNGGGNQTIGAFAYHNLVFSGGGDKSMAAGTSVAGNLSIAPTGTAKASVAAGQNLAVGTLHLGGVQRAAGTWGSTSSSAANKNDTCFAATTGYLTVANGPQAVASVTYHLGTHASYTTIQGGPNTLPWIKKGTLPAGSILRAVIANATMEMKIQEDHEARFICLYINPTPDDHYPVNTGCLEVGGYWGYGEVNVPINAGGWNIGDTANETHVATKDYTATVVTNAENFRLFVVKAAATGLASSDYDCLSLVPVSRHANKGVPAIFTVANETDFTTNIYLQDYLRRYRPATINTINFSATIPNFTSSAINAAGPLELSVAMATGHWTSSAKVVLVSDAVDTTNYPNVLQASALAAALDAPLIYYNANSAKQTLVQNAIAQLGATEVVYVNAAGTKPAMANLVLTNPATIVNYLAGKGITVDYFATTNPTDLNLVTCAKLSLTAPLVAARRTGIVVPEASWA